MQGSFEKNLKLLEKHNPLFAFQLRLIDLNNTAVPKENTVIFAPKEETEVIYVYGLRLNYKQFKVWLQQKKERRLVFLEDDLDAFRYFLDQVESERILLDSQVQLIPLNHSIETALKEVIWTHLFRPYELIVTAGKSRAFQNVFTNLQMKIEMKMCLYRDYGVPQIKNIIHNLNFPGEIILGDQLENKFKGIPAILCGAGPSIEKNMEELKSLENHALIFAGGSALGFLSKNHVPIHFGASLDPSPPSERFLRQTYFELPFFYQNQVASELFFNLHGKCICFGESSGFPLERWVMGQLGIHLSYFDVGTHVGTFLTTIAEFLGCSPIIFVGMDSCRSGEAVYPKGVEQAGEKEGRTDPLVTHDRFGQLVQTRMDFLLGRSWIEGFVKLHKETCFLNATEEGLAMAGINNISLKELRKSKLSTSFDSKAMVHQVLESLQPLSFSSGSIEVLTKRLFQSILKCLAICEDLLGLLGKDSKQLTYQNAHYALQDLELSEEIFYQMVLLPLWDVWRHFLQKEEVIAAMQIPKLEKKIQQTLFFRDVCVSYTEMISKIEFSAIADAT